MSVWHGNECFCAITIKENAPDLRQGRFLLYGGEEDVLAIKASELKNKKYFTQ
ncbi:Hypoticical protein [Pectobacterium parmentieri]|uniref:Hypoticical protein n=1 Tax=Pectobacterium parmentieri TaxID=1905730 RepID=A0A0H3I5A8_PECPM|nr:Hypoticical protein [Pectobacterium parmentieri]POW27372.1 hypothetical protein PB20LOC_02015 [Pectobacterium parmentieri]